MKIIFLDNNKFIEKATLLANQILINDLFYIKIAEHHSFDFSNASPEIIANLLRNSTLEFRVDMFYPGFFGRLGKYRKTLAYTDSRYPNVLFLNSRKLNRSVEEIASTIIHEAIHALDNSESIYTFGHGNNSPVGKENSAPYWIGNLVFTMFGKPLPDNKLLIFDQEEDDDGVDLA